MKRESNLCVFCGGKIPTSRSLNSNTCCDAHSYELKKNNQLEYARNQAAQRELLRSDEIMHELRSLYNRDCHLSTEHLIKRNFNWVVNKGEITIAGYKAKVLIRYAYCLLNDQTIYIWKLL